MAQFRQRRQHFAARHGLGAQGGLGVARQLLDAVVRDLDAEVLRRHVFHFVRLVEDQGGVIGQQPGILRLPQGEVGEKEMVIDDEDVGLRRALAHQGDVAAVELLALLAGASLTARINPRPELARVRQVFELGAVAALRVLLPLANLDVEVHLFHAGEYRLLFDVVELLPAEVILAALHQGGANLGEELLEERNVLEENLLLQVLGAGGDHHALAAADDGHKVGERLARSRACLDDQVLAILQRRFHRLRHLELPAAVLVGGMMARQPAAWPEDLLQGDFFSCFLA